jgi:hypothetical protein
MTSSLSARAARSRPLLPAFLLVLGIGGCEKKGPASTTVEAPLQVSSAQFQQLRWIEGSWRGTGGGVDAFYEGYRWTDDSTIAKYDYADSTLGMVTDSGTIALRAGVVRSGTERSYVVVALDSTTVRFAPERNAANGFEWRRTAPDAWTARLTWDSAGVAKERVYELRAHRPLP